MCVSLIVLLCSLCVQDLSSFKVQCDNLPSNSIISLNNFVCVPAAGAKLAGCSDSSSQEEVLHLTKSCAYSEANGVSR